MPTDQELIHAAERLHSHLEKRHYAQGLIHGPDAGVRFNLRLWRFVKSALDFIAWNDDYVFMQSQGYWILSNWMLYELTGNPKFRAIAIESTEAVLRLQQAGGYWLYPLPERRHLIATVEGDWAAAGLLATYAREPRKEFLSAAVRWYDYLVGMIGFQPHDSGKAINYFDKPRGKIPNNSVEAVWLFLRLAKASGDAQFAGHADSMLDFIAASQLHSGELPYIVEGPHEKGRQHYLCYQYNAFQFLKLAWAESLRPDPRTERVLPVLAGFLCQGVTDEGASSADCHHTLPETDYFTAVLAAALNEAKRRGRSEAGELSDRCYVRLLKRQKYDGSFAYTDWDYGFLSDGRSYPRPLAMTLFHLLYPACGNGYEKKPTGH